MARHSMTSLTSWRVLVPVIALLAGLMFAVTSQTASGGELRSERSDLTELITKRERAIALHQDAYRTLTEQISALQDHVATSDAEVAGVTAEADELAPSVGLSALSGPAVKVVLTDAPPGPYGSLPPGARPDDVVIHQSDVQGVVNAMWAAGADAITIMGERIITTSAVRCVGNTLLLGGKTYSPPFEIVAIGNQSEIEYQLKNSPGVQLFLDAVNRFGLGYDVSRIANVTIPAYDGSLGVSYATAVR